LIAEKKEKKSACSHVHLLSLPSSAAWGEGKRGVHNFLVYPPLGGGGKGKGHSKGDRESIDRGGKGGEASPQFPVPSRGWKRKTRLEEGKRGKERSPSNGRVKKKKRSSFTFRKRGVRGKGRTSFLTL